MGPREIFIEFDSQGFQREECRAEKYRRALISAAVTKRRAGRDHFVQTTPTRQGFTKDRVFTEKTGEKACQTGTELRFDDRIALKFSLCPLQKLHCIDGCDRIQVQVLHLAEDGVIRKTEQS